MPNLPSDAFTTLFHWADAHNISEVLFPRDSAILQNMEVLKLHDCNLQTLPEEIGLLTNLKKLYLSYNKLETLPETLGGLKKLETLWVQGNALSSLPVSLAMLPMLKELAAFHNMIETIPQEIIDAPKLKALYLQDNFLNQDTLDILNKSSGKEISTGNQSERFHAAFHQRFSPKELRTIRDVCATQFALDDEERITVVHLLGEDFAVQLFVDDNNEIVIESLRSDMLIRDKTALMALLLQKRG